MQHAVYLFFLTGCEAALDFYTACGLGRVTEMARLDNGLIQHARFEGPGLLLYASDNDDAEPMRGFANFLTFASRDETRRLFAQMGEGGTITTPLGPQPWSPCYGKLTDRFGVQWMFNCDQGDRR